MAHDKYPDTVPALEDAWAGRFASEGTEATVAMNELCETLFSTFPVGPKASPLISKGLGRG